ncbi:hypothetical protein [Silvimonas iriomotensis]|uniref:hypothetical protein n=1 Tax=Silvimonas iriomotensis TaxID=449662 RepID=UPI00166C8CAB|nr:hypothetical protein [Silvimonas iriomotensis]
MADDIEVKEFDHAGHHLRVTVWKSGHLWKWSYVIDGLHEGQITKRPFTEKGDSMSEGMFVAKYRAGKMPPLEKN